MTAWSESRDVQGRTDLVDIGLTALLEHCPYIDMDTEQPEAYRELVEVVLAAVLAKGVLAPPASR